MQEIVKIKPRFGRERTMAKLYFRYGVMGSSKTANALMMKFNYTEKGYKTVLLKPAIDTRDGTAIIRSRIGIESEAYIVQKDYDILMMLAAINLKEKTSVQCIVADEAQFFTEIQIEQLKTIAEVMDIPVFCYGLRTDFQSHLFEGSKRLLELADDISEIKSICHCGSKAIINCRYDGDKVIYDGDQIVLGGNDRYVGLCYRCWIEGKLK